MRQEKSANKERRSIIQFRVSEDEKKIFSDKASDAGMNVTDFIKFRAIDKQPQRIVGNRIQKTLIKIQSELGIVRSNVNQIGKAISDKTNYSIDLKNTIAKTSIEIRDLSDVITLSLHKASVHKNLVEENLSTLFSSLIESDKYCNEIAKMVNAEQRASYKITIRENVITDVITKVAAVISTISKHINHGDQGQASG